MARRTTTAAAAAKPTIILGIDIGGTGIKGAPVDVTTGELVGERFRLETPQPATPEAVVATVAEIVKHFDWHGPIGVGFPAVVKYGTVSTAANIDKSWIGKDAAGMISEATGCSPVAIGNDADVAGLAEATFGEGKGKEGLIFLCTLGTGIGTALILDGKLIPNTELGHLELKGMDAETYAADSAREREDLSWEKWAKRVNRYLTMVENLFWPDLIIVGGGVSKKADKFFPLLSLRTPVVPAALQNEAGIVGAACWAAARL
jgi:polyphosphate glucokinase